MKSHFTRLVAIGLVLVGCFPAAGSRALAALQDNWTVDRAFDPVPGGIDLCFGIGVDSAERVYIADRTRNQIHVFSPAGKYERSIVIQADDTSGIPQSFFVGGDDRLYINYFISASPNFKQSVYATDGTRIGRRPYNLLPDFGCAIDANGDVYIPRLGQAIEVYSADGTHARTIGAAGTGPGDLVSLNGSTGVAISPEGRVIVMTGTAGSAGGRVLLIFSKTGEFEARIVNGPGDFQPIGIGADNLWYFAYRGTIFTMDGRSLFSGTDLSAGGPFVVNPRTTIFYYWDLKRKVVTALRRGFRTLGAATPGAVPLPVIRRTTQRPNGLIDIDCIVTDRDSGVVSTALCAYKHGSGLLRDLVPISASTLVEGTSAFLGQGVPTGEVFRLTWDASAAGLPSGSLNFELLSRDARPAILDVDYITLPGEPVLTISRSPITHADMRTAWTWLLATGDPELSRTPDGEVTGPGGAFTLPPGFAQSFPGGSGTTDAGRAWLFAKLGAREATPEEISRARQASAFAAPHQFTPPAAAQMTGNSMASDTYPATNVRPMKGNEWTFDSWDQWQPWHPQAKYNEGWWLVRIP